MSRLTRDGTAEPVSRDQIFRHARGQGNIHFPCSADHEQYWQPYPVDPYSAICDDHTYIYVWPYIHTYIHTAHHPCVLAVVNGASGAIVGAQPGAFAAQQLMDPTSGGPPQQVDLFSR